MLGSDVKEDEVKSVIELIDANNDGYVSQEEFYHLLFILENSNGDTKRTLFLSADANCTGKVGSKELTNVLDKLGYKVDQKTIDQAVAEITGKKKNEVSYSQFNQLLELVAKKQQQ